LLPSGPGGVCKSLLRRTQLSTPLHVRQALQKGQAAHEGFSPAIADCRRQGTATSPPSTASRLSRVLSSLVPRRRPLRVGHRPPSGVAVPLRGIDRRKRMQRASQRSLPSVHGVSHALDGFLRLRPCGFISPHSHVQGSLWRELPLVHERNRLVGDPCPLGVGSISLPPVSRRRHAI